MEKDATRAINIKATNHCGTTIEMAKKKMKTDKFINVMTNEVRTCDHSK
jgi:hypothetical protein